MVWLSRSGVIYGESGKMEFEFIENPIVGKFYDVPCIRAISTDRFVAILPHKHTDMQFGSEVAAKPHYHFDTRFFAKHDYQLLATDFRERCASVHVVSPEHAEWAVRFGYRNYDEIRVLKRKCQSTFTGHMKAQLSSGSKAAAWYRSQIGKSCAGRICPHFRQPMLERDGVLECPYHGLIGDPKTEKIIGNIHRII